jgi:ABC-2 type transport system permease protein
MVAGLGASTLAVTVGGLGLGAGYALVGGGWDQVPRLLGASLAYLPAVWLVATVAVALFGLVPQWTVLAWVALVLCLVVGMFGTLLDLPAWALDLSPFQHVPAVPADSLRALPLVVLVVIAAALTAAGLWAFRARDLQPS